MIIENVQPIVKIQIITTNVDVNATTRNKVIKE